MIKYLTNENEFSSLIKGRILVDFYADWCGPCQLLAEVLENLEGIDILKINTDMFPDLARKFGIMSIPTLILFNNGEEIKKSIGLKTLAELQEFIQG